MTLHAATRGAAVLGFGSALTDTSAYNAFVFANATTRGAFVEALWGASGLRLSLGRVTLNSADYSFQSFNYDAVPDDFALAHFDGSLAYDAQRVIPLIRAATAAAGGGGGAPLRLFASPWSPPAWMKANNNMIDSALPCLRNDTAAGQSYAGAWAAYIARWLAAMEAQGVAFWGLTPQNEPMAQQQKFESCAYGTADMAEFLAAHLGPALRARFPALRILGYDHNKLAAPAWAAALLGNATVAPFLDGFALHWYDYEHDLALESVAAIRAQLGPDAPFLGTEACFLSSLTLDWRAAALYMADIVGDLNFGAQG